MCAVLCRAVPCCAVLCHAVPCCAMPPVPPLPKGKRKKENKETHPDRKDTLPTARVRATPAPPSMLQAPRVMAAHAVTLLPLIKCLQRRRWQPRRSQGGVCTTRPLAQPATPHDTHNTYLGDNVENEVRRLWRGKGSGAPTTRQAAAEETEGHVPQVQTRPG
jgi:hypothetical protein